MRSELSGAVGPEPRRVQDLKTLARELGLLLARAAHGTGRPRVSLAELTRRLALPASSKSSIHCYVSGKTLAPSETLDAIVIALGGTPSEQQAWNEAWFRVSDQLRNKGALDRSVESSRRSTIVPRQLPLDVRGFTGRAKDLSELESLRLDRADDSSNAVVISAIAGTAGVGKTALAVHWAHQVSGYFPDGQLYVDLRGYDSNQPVRPVEALSTFLRDLGVNDADIPPEISGCCNLYRTLLADRQLLIVLDNARSVEQVRPLLPGARSCFVVITSRDALSGLVARDGAKRIDVDRLPLNDAVALLQLLIGDRACSDPESTTSLAEKCARLPLALRVAAELAVSRPSVAMKDLVDDLASERHRLDILDAGGDRHTAVRVVFSWSYRYLANDVAQTFRLLGLQPGRDIGIHALAALVGVDLVEARRLISKLLRAHLLEQVEDGRFEMHDLLRTYASEMAETSDTPIGRKAALNRLFDFYLHTASLAIDTHYPHESHRRPQAQLTGFPAPTVSDHASATAWIEAEIANLVAIAGYAAERGCPNLPNHLSVTMWAYLLNHSYHSDAINLHAHALQASVHQKDRTGECRALNNLGTVYERLRRYPEAIDHLCRGLVLSQRLGDRFEEVRALSNLGVVCWLMGWYVEALSFLENSLAQSRELSDCGNEAYALCKVGIVYRSLGRYREAVEHLRAALTLTRQIHDQIGEAFALSDLGATYERQGNFREAQDCLHQALTLSRELGDRAVEGLTLGFLGVLCRSMGCYPEALEHLRLAITIDRKLGDQCLAAKALNDLGRTFCLAGEPAHAISRHHEALVLARKIGDRYEQGRAYDYIARANLAMGCCDTARRSWCEALAVYATLEIPDAGEVRACLVDLDLL